MEIAWKVLLELCSGLLLLCCGLCNGLPINLENTAADSHTQLLTGLVAVLLTVCSVVFLAGCLCCQRRNGFKVFRDSPVVASTASNLDHGHVNPVANGEFTIFTPLSPPHQNNNVFLANQQIINRTPEDYSYGDVDVSSWFSGTETDFPRIKLKYIKEIGKGWFGRVVEGTAQDISPDQKWTPVVVRILEATASSKERIVFLHDAAIYRCGSHPNIMKLFGRCLDTVPLLLMQEYCLQGDLKKYLRQNQPTADQLLSSEYPLVWCCQLTSALKHLHDNRLTHPDLAARNCQLTSNLTLKLGDYGLAVFQYPEDYYQGAPGVPVRWCAPESLSFTSTTIQPKTITPEANIWSLAVTLWEICECGRQPYGDLNDDEVISQVLGTSNVWLSRPKCQVLYTDYIFRLMQLCWTSAESRPGVSQIDLMLADLLQVHKNTQSNEDEESLQTPEDFDRRWASFKPNTIVKMDNHVDDEITISKPLSPSLNNLHGSLDNLVQQQEIQMESWLENVATKTGDMSYVKGLSDAIKDLDNALALENGSSSDSSHQQSPAPQDLKSKPRIEFKLGLPFRNRLGEGLSFNQNDQNSLNDNSLLFMRTSSGSETEEENWKKKIERGAYSEKVRQKSRSVADLMVLTHIDPSESESETPLPSLDFTKANYKNVRYAAAPKQNLESMSLMYGSEGNLLNVQETFQEELRKLQEEQRKDNSLLFVPEKRNSVSSDSNVLCEDSPSKRLLQELNSPSEIKPASQVFNVFNVTIDKFSPVHVKAPSHFTEFNKCNKQVPKLSDLIQNQLSTFLVEESKQHFVQPGDEDGVRLLEPVEALNKVLIEQAKAESSQIKLGENEVELEPVVEAVNHVLVDQAKVEVPRLNLNKVEQELSHDEVIPVNRVLEVSSDSNLDLGQNEVELKPVEAVNHVLVDHANVEVPELNLSEVESEAVSNHVFVDPKVERLEPIEPVNQVLVDRGEEEEEEVPVPIESDFDFGQKETDFKPVEAVNCVLIDHAKTVPEINLKNVEPEAVLNHNQLVLNEVELEPELNNELLEPVEAINRVLVDQPEIIPSQIELRQNNKSQPIQLSQGEIELEQASTLSETPSPIHPDALQDAELSDGTEDLDFIPSLNGANNLVKEQNQSIAHITENKVCHYEVPKLVDLIQNNDALMDYIIDRYDTESSAAVTPQPPQHQPTTPAIDPIEKTKEFLRTEHENYEDSRRCEVSFDLSSDQDEVMPNSLTHSSVFTVSGIKSLQELPPDVIQPNIDDAFSSLNLFRTSSPAADPKEHVEQKKLFSLETWDNFLGKTFDDQENAQLFDSFSSEPQSLLIVDTSSSSSQGDKTFTVKSADDTYVVDVNDIDVELDDGEDIHRDNGCGGSWESNGGWFLHPQSNSEDISGEITVQPGTSTGSYVGGYKMDDEIMAAVRSELMNKLPQAQGASLSSGIDDDDVDSFERNEVFLQYNVYNTPLSPIPEESMIEENSGENTPRQQDSDNEGDEGDWSEHDTTEHPESAQMESPTRGPQHRHTPSQDSCCSNDTLFNLEELNIHDNNERCETESPTLKENDTHQESKMEDELVQESKNVNVVTAATPQIQEPEDKTYIEEFLVHEREDCCFKDNNTNQSTEEQSSNSDKLLPFVNTKHVAPLPSPEDKPAWKQMPLSLSSPPQEESQEVVVATTTDNGVVDYVNLQDRYDEHEYENVIGDDDDQHGKNFYENVSTNIDDIYNEADYVNIVNLENSKNSAKLVADEDGGDKTMAEYVEYDDALIIPNEDDGDVAVEHDVFGVLTDIRFSGPGDSQLMTTSFSESNDLNDEQDWDSGSDTRSSSSGEFIWKEGEHEESLKALRAAPQDVLEDMKPMEGIREETYSSSSDSDEEGESHEFVPSAWDKYATPTKSALRSPEKTLEKTDKKKSKAVWFKKQKYHCVYEYPREPDSPVMHSLWTPQQDYSPFADWDVDQTDAFAAVPTTQDTSSSDDNAGEFQSATTTTQNLYYQPKASRNLNLYQLSSVPDFISSSGSSLDDEFFISSSAKPFDIINGLSSQFFPGNNWTTDSSKNDNITPDSGVEDITPAGTTETEFSNGMPRQRTVPSLKVLSSRAVAKKLKKTTTTTESELKSSGSEVLGGLRHTRNKLKLDLPPSPSAFTSSKMFNIESASTNNLDPVISREKPTFSTFGKSRFLVQHVDTPPDDEASSNSKNVSFEALPYKPPPLEKHIINDDLDKLRTKVEMVRGEASLLDSADEDSGIESSTLERKLSGTVD